MATGIKIGAWQKQQLEPVPAKNEKRGSQKERATDFGQNAIHGRSRVGTEAHIASRLSGKHAAA
jgi:hypothetical protein